MRIWGSTAFEIAVVLASAVGTTKAIEPKISDNTKSFLITIPP